jgi:phage shock protein A
MQAEKLEQSVVKLDTQARQALARASEDLARMALERKTSRRPSCRRSTRRSPSSRTSRPS